MSNKEKKIELPLRQDSIREDGKYYPNPDQKCPLCLKNVEGSSRYPNYVCGDCSSKKTDKDGRKVVYGNTSMSGGCQGYYLSGPKHKVDYNNLYNDSICYIKVDGLNDAIPCRAEEGRFGGIVVQPVYESNI